MSHPGRDKGRGRGGGGGRPEPGRAVTVSKALSYILRHAAEKEGVQMDRMGYANVRDVMAWRKLKSLKVTFPEILDAVSTSDKQRFGLLYKPPTTPAAADSSATEEKEKPPPESDPDNPTAPSTPSPSATATATAQALTTSTTDPEPSHYLIRATQGHSIKTIEAASLLEKLSLSDPQLLPDTVVHGTYHAAWPAILAFGGLKCMSRNQIHFATGPKLDEVLPEGKEGPVAVAPEGKQGGVISGMRGDAQILIYVDLKRAMEAGVPFWRSENGVILSEGVDDGRGGGEKVVGVEFFDVVVERKRGLGVLWDGGELVRETPGWMLAAKSPKGGGKGGDGKGGGRGKGKGKERGPRVMVEKETDVVDVDE
ncbi:hypothetical protein FQN50_001188 [Emmonsiellopsis sp. PD_5]|nr:hypothetical protein FQN50_001188 [Emmonsiellopsis sp. PD_5]